MQVSADNMVLGIETSCDETAVAIVDGSGTVRAHQLFSQLAAHAPYGGVVPEIAARAHIERLDGLVAAALEEADVALSDMTAIAATAGPGLIGGVIVGLMTGKTLAAATGRPFFGINHLAAHALSVRLVEDVPFPYLLLLMSGGHAQFVWVQGVDRFHLLGSTIDDALGEAFDKLAKMLGLGYPGGPAVEKLASLGDPSRFDLPRPLMGRDGCDFSFAGLKTAARREIEKRDGKLSEQDKADLCASFQAAAADVLADRLEHAVDTVFGQKKDAGAGDNLLRRGESRRLVIAGGVAANASLRQRLTGVCAAREVRFLAPPAWLCTDNGAMVAWAGMERLRAGGVASADALSLPARARWPL